MTLHFKNCLLTAGKENIKMHCKFVHQKRYDGALKQSLNNKVESTTREEPELACVYFELQEETF